MGSPSHAPSPPENPGSSRANRVGPRDLWHLRGRVGRAAYLRWGLGLMLLKYAVDAGLVAAWSGAFWNPLDYLDPVYGRRVGALPVSSAGLLWFQALWALPFLWIGVTLSVRRAVDAGGSGWGGLVFLLPYVNYLGIAVLATLPAAAQPQGDAPEAEDPARAAAAAGLSSLAVGLLWSAALAGVLGLIWFLSESVGALTGSLFLTLPFLLGVVTGFVVNRRADLGVRTTLLRVGLSLCVIAAGLLLFALEGVLCIAMALPLALCAAVPGALLGRHQALAGRRPGLAALGFLALPLSAGLEARDPRPPLREVLTVIEVDAPPARVWPWVIAFSELPEPDSLLFRTGVAYPVRARIEGSGVGAVRHCVFSTGAFVEPITAWEEPTLLAFDVSASPAPMQEWSFWSRIEPRHLTRAFRSRRGEFRLLPLEGERTRLEGRTWITLDMGPQAYWTLWSDWLVHSIHRRVLEHVRDLAEAR